MVTVKQEPADVPRFVPATNALSYSPPITIDLCSSDSESDGCDDEEARAYLNQLILEEENERCKRVRVSDDNSDSDGKRQRIVEYGVDLEFLAPARTEELAVETREDDEEAVVVGDRIGNVSGGELSTVCSGMQFWKAGDYEGGSRGDWVNTSVGMDHVRVHPRFLHSNATSHKWVLGAFAELLDNALDEVCNGATFVNIDTITNEKDKSHMLLIEDNGGGMDPDKMRQCMSLGYSMKSKIANTIGQYGNGFKTSTMRLGADVIVFSRCRGKVGKRPTQSIGLLSYTFLRMTGKEDILVPMLDYERGMGEWKKLMRPGTTHSDWDRNAETVLHWSPFSSEEDLLGQFNLMTDHGTRVIVYNLWEDDQEQLELDFEADNHDIQISGVNRDEKNIQMANQYPNSRHFLTYRHSLRSYASILYLRLPAGFRIILRGKDVEHHNIVNDMIHSEEITYRPQAGAEGIPRDSNICAMVTIGFVKDAVYHIDVQGFNVYHKNRLIKPFWRIWNASGSDGRGVIGLLEANFIEPAHDKQGFERTSVLSRLENRLVHMQRQYWSNNCQLIGYSQRRGKKITHSENDDSSPNFQYGKSSQPKTRGIPSASPSLGQRRYSNGHWCNATPPSKNRMESVSNMPTSSSSDDIDVVELHSMGSNQKPTSCDSPFLTNDYSILEQLKEENRLLSERLLEEEDNVLSDLQKELESERKKDMLIETEIDEIEKKIEEMNKEQESLIDIFSNERERRDVEEENLKKKLQEANNRIIELTEKVDRLERK